MKQEMKQVTDETVEHIGRGRLIEELSSMTFRLDRSEMDWLKQHGKEEKLIPGRIMRSLLKVYRQYVDGLPPKKLAKAFEDMDRGQKK